MGQNTREEALLIPPHTKDIMKRSGKEMRKWISDDITFMSLWAAKGFHTYPVDTSISLRTNKTKVLCIAWEPLDDRLTSDTNRQLEFISTNKNTKRLLVKAVGKIFDPLGLLFSFTIRMKCLIQELWMNKITWGEDLPPKIVERCVNRCKELSFLNKPRIPIFIIDSTSAEINDIIEIHTFCDASKLAYGVLIYVKMKKTNIKCL
ncbi:uncharacterized protein NPIL_418671 [Nephila pilipes]|uniref:Uncharacterized protein n=1 Tax=Nephila pilipes TaxID=299642 RepID=A0A8X6IMU8_NEPPI|nr:uncharacterized protein NPIL_418671 [Nephila pilipes]